MIASVLWVAGLASRQLSTSGERPTYCETSVGQRSDTQLIKRMHDQRKGPPKSIIPVLGLKVRATIP